VNQVAQDPSTPNAAPVDNTDVPTVDPNSIAANTNESNRLVEITTSVTDNYKPFEPEKEGVIDLNKLAE